MHVSTPLLTSGLGLRLVRTAVSTFCPDRSPSYLGGPPFVR